ncbi:MAG: hypothetical protein AAB903_02870 [Patescibacteria group bacterium]
MELSQKTLLDGKIGVGEPIEGFLEWISQRSITRFPILFWRLPRKFSAKRGWQIPRPYPEKIVKKFIINNRLIISNCIIDEEIRIDPGQQDGIKRYVITPKGYEYMANFWHKGLFENLATRTTITAIITVLVTLLFTGYIVVREKDQSAIIYEARYQ